MKLRIRACVGQSYPIGGVLIKGTSVKTWLLEIQSLNISLETSLVYPIPGNGANSIWGCFVQIPKALDEEVIGQHEYCQRVCSNLYIPEHSELFPALKPSELEKHFYSKHIAHPEFGWVELTKPLSFKEFVKPVKVINAEIWKPTEQAFVPMHIKSFQVKPVSDEELEEKLFVSLPDSKELKDDPLNLLEKGKLSIYRTLFERNKNKGKTEKTEFFKGIERVLGIGKNTTQNLMSDFESLEHRNQQQLDKLMDLLKNNPDEALKYAIPLDSNNSSRGKMTEGQFTLSERRSSFSLFGSGGIQTGGGSINLGSHFDQLKAQYHQTARDLIAKKDFKKAAFIYLKLLKDYELAASTLESGKLYQEAAKVYLEHLNNKQRAAECYEKGKMITAAIDLYIELGQNEKVGDLYLRLNRGKDADLYFTKVMDEYVNNNQFVRAALICKNKMKNIEKAQELLMQGWMKPADPFNCLIMYFANIQDVKTLRTEVNWIYKNRVSHNNCIHFLRAICHLYNLHEELKTEVKEMAYRIVSTQVENRPSIVNELRGFSEENNELGKDISKFTAM